MHCIKKLQNFVDFLSSYVISEETIEKLLLFLYVDDSMDGIEKVRHYTSKIINILDSRLRKLNNEKIYKKC